MRLYTTLLDAAQKISPAKRIQMREVMEPVMQAVPLDITQVYEWLTLEKSGEPLAELFAALPTCRPPFEYTYMEYDTASGPPGVIPAVGTTGPEVTRIGVILYTCSKAEFATMDSTFEHYGYWGIPTREVAEGHAGVMLTLPDDGVVVWGRVLLHQTNGDVGILRDVNGFLMLDGQGNLITETDADGITWVAYRIDTGELHDGETETERENARTSFSEAFYTAMFATSLLHCRNVSTIDNRLPRQQARHRERHKLPPIGWKTLAVAPHGRWVYQGQERRYLDGTTNRQDSRKHRQHIVRGYFAEYGTNGRGLLFGKHSGRYWVPPHIRGIDGPGVILKDYAVMPDRTRVAAKRKDPLCRSGIR